MRTRYRQIGFAIAISLILVLWFDGLLMAEDGSADNSITQLLTEFEKITNDWWEPLGRIGQQVFLGMVTIELAFMGIRLAFQKSDMQDLSFQLLMFAVSSLFVWALILYYRDFCGWMTDGLMGFSKAMPTGHGSVDVGHPVAFASRYTSLLFKGLKEATLNFLSLNLPLFISSLIFTCCVVVIFIVSLAISGMFILVKCEFFILAPVGVIFVGFGGLKMFRDYAINVMRYILSVALKLLILQLLMNICFAFLDTQLDTISTAISAGFDPSTIQRGPLGLPTESIFSFKNRAYQGLVAKSLLMMGYSIIVLCLVAKIPDACSGLISGASMGGGGNPVLGFARTGIGTAIGAATGIGVAGAGFAMTARAGYSMARQQGVGVSGALMGAIKSGAGATFFGGTKTGSQLAAIKRAAMPPDVSNAPQTNQTNQQPAPEKFSYHRPQDSPKGDTKD